jgi:hypothetical protein
MDIPPKMSPCMNPMLLDADIIPDEIAAPEVGVPC